MAGLPTNQRDQIMAFVGVLGLLGAVAYYMYIYSAAAEKIAETRTHIEKLDQNNQRAKAIMARGSMQQLQEESNRLKANLDLMRSLIPTGNEVPALLQEILGAARRTGLEVSGFNPGATVEGEMFNTVKYRLSFQGDYHQIGELLTAVGSLRRIIVPVNVSLTPSGSADARAAALRGEQILTANFDIQTYVARAATAEDK